MSKPKGLAPYPVYKASKIKLSIKLVKAALKQLAFLELVNVERDLLHSESNLVRRALWRYEVLWLPLALKHNLYAAPLDIHWMWHVHMLSPELYRADCSRVLGDSLTVVVLDHRCLSTQRRKKELERSARHWREAYLTPQIKAKDKEEPQSNLQLEEDEASFDYESEVADEHRRACPRYESKLQYDIAAAISRQKDFFYQVSLAHYRDTRFLERGLERYRKYLFMKQQHPDALFVPCYDMDLVWHTHQLHPLAYARDTMGLLHGHLLNHDDSLTDRHVGSKLVKSDALTRHWWRIHFPNCHFAVSGAMFRGDPPYDKMATLSREELFAMCEKRVHITVCCVCSQMPNMEHYDMVIEAVNVSKFSSNTAPRAVTTEDRLPLGSTGVSAANHSGPTASPQMTLERVLFKQQVTAPVAQLMRDCVTQCEMAAAAPSRSYQAQRWCLLSSSWLESDSSSTSQPSQNGSNLQRHGNHHPSSANTTVTSGKRVQHHLSEGLPDTKSCQPLLAPTSSNSSASASSSSAQQKESSSTNLRRKRCHELGIRRREENVALRVNLQTHVSLRVVKRASSCCGLCSAPQEDVAVRYYPLLAYVDPAKEECDPPLVRDVRLMTHWGDQIGTTSVHLQVSSPQSYIYSFKLQSELSTYSLVRIPAGEERKCRAFWGPIHILHQMAAVEHLAWVARHKLLNHLQQECLEVRVIHSVAHCLSVVQVFHGTRLVALAHSVAYEQLPTEELQGGDNVVLDTSSNMRVMLVKDADGDWAILTGRWTGLVKGRGDQNSGHAGHLNLALYTLKGQRRTYFSRIPDSVDDVCAVFHQMSVDMRTRNIQVNRSTRSVPQNVCLAFAAATLMVLCQPRVITDKTVKQVLAPPPDTEPPSRHELPVWSYHKQHVTTGVVDIVGIPLPHVPPKPKTIVANEKIHLLTVRSECFPVVVACGYTFDLFVPSNMLLLLLAVQRLRLQRDRGPAPPIPTPSNNNEAQASQNMPSRSEVAGSSTQQPPDAAPVTKSLPAESMWLSATGLLHHPSHFGDGELPHLVNLGALANFTSTSSTPVLVLASLLPPTEGCFVEASLNLMAPPAAEPAEDGDGLMAASAGAGVDGGACGSCGACGGCGA